MSRRGGGGKEKKGGGGGRGTGTKDLLAERNNFLWTGPDDSQTKISNGSTAALKDLWGSSWRRSGGPWMHVNDAPLCGLATSSLTRLLTQSGPEFDCKTISLSISDAPAKRSYRLGR